MGRPAGHLGGATDSRSRQDLKALPSPENVRRTCDQGWAAGSISTAGILLPGNVTTSFHYDEWNYVVSPELPLMSGIPATLYHQYASHESLGNLPVGATVYCVDSAYRPTVVEFPLGDGWVVITGQPWEHQFAYPNWGGSTQVLLFNGLAYFTGSLDLRWGMPFPTPAAAVRPSGSQ
jgi:hypothetical protein